MKKHEHYSSLTMEEYERGYRNGRRAGKWEERTRIYETVNFKTAKLKHGGRYWIELGNLEDILAPKPTKEDYQ